MNKGLHEAKKPVQRIALCAQINVSGLRWVKLCWFLWWYEIAQFSASFAYTGAVQLLYNTHWYTTRFIIVHLRCTPRDMHVRYLEVSIPVRAPYPLAYSINTPTSTVKAPSSHLSNNNSDQTPRHAHHCRETCEFTAQVGIP